MSVFIKNFALLRISLNFKKYYFIAAHGLKNHHTLNHKEQIDYLKSINDSNKHDWTEIKTEVFKKSGSLNNKNIDAVILKVLINDKKFNTAVAFADHLKSSNEELSLGVINGILQLYYAYGKENNLSDNMKQFILDNYKNLYEKHKLLDYSTCEKLLHALCSVNEWKKSMKVLDDICQTGVPTHSAYSTLIATLFKNNKRTEALKMIEKSIQNRRPLIDIAYDEWIKYIFRKYKDKTVILKHLNEICNLIADNCISVNIFTAQRLKESFEEINWNSKLTKIVKHSGQCTTCQAYLECLKLSDQEFELLQKNVKDKLIVGSDLLLKSTQEELDKFLKFINKTAPYDVVLDSLNIALSIGRTDVNERIKVLRFVVDHFVRNKKKVLFLGRKHMLKWKQLDSILCKTECFFIDNISQDDPYIITAAILSGSHTDIVSRDLLRGHKFLLQQDHLKRLFQRWQWQHQWMVFLSKYKPVIQTPLCFTPIAQKNDKGWHLPFVEDKNMGTESDGFPDISMWLCLRPKTNLTINNRPV